MLSSCRGSWDHLDSFSPAPTPLAASASVRSRRSIASLALGGLSGQRVLNGDVLLYDPLVTPHTSRCSSLYYAWNGHGLPQLWTRGLPRARSRVTFCTLLASELTDGAVRALSYLWPSPLFFAAAASVRAWILPSAISSLPSYATDKRAFTLRRETASQAALPRFAPARPDNARLKRASFDGDADGSSC